LCIGRQGPAGMAAVMVLAMRTTTIRSAQSIIFTLDTIQMYSYTSNMGRGLSFEGIDISFGLSLPGEGGWDAASAPPDWGARIASLRRVLGDFLPDGGFSSAELPIEALAGGSGSRDWLSRGGLREIFGAEATARDFCLRLGRPFVDPDCPAAPYRAAVTECRAVYAKCAAGATTSYAVAPAAGNPTAGGPQAVSDPAISAFLLEFPLGFAYGTRERRHLDRLVRDLEGLPLAIAFYNPTWYSLRVIEALREKNIGLCLMDFPLPRNVAGMANATGGLASAQGLTAQGVAPPRFDMATSSLVYLKFHGFSPARAVAGELEARLASWIPRLEALALQAQTLRVIFQGEDA